MAVMLGVSFIVTVLLTPLAASLARRLGVVDHPGPLKVQTAPIPYLGGLAVGAGLIVAPLSNRPLLAIPLVLALALGVADDVVDLDSRLRFACELVIGALVADLVRTDLPGPIGYVAVVIATILLINAVNLIDGLDAMASGVGIASAAAFAVILSGGRAAQAIALAGALLGFLVYNRPPARIYLGDGGSYLVGTSLAILLAASWRHGQPLSTSLGGLLAVAYPVGEVAVAVIRRARARLPLFEGDRAHVYDLLVARGWSVPRTVVACAGLQAVLSCAGIVASRSPAPAAGALVAAAIVVLLVGAGAAGFLSPGYAAKRE